MVSRAVQFRFMLVLTSVQMESAPEHARRTTRTWCALLGHLCPGSDMANSQVLPDTVHPPWMAQLPIRFCHGIPASADRNAPLLVLATRLQMKRDDTKSHILKLKHNVYGQKQAGRVWNQCMDQGMREISFTPSKYNPCLYYHGSVIFLEYIDDCIVFGPDDKAIDKVVMDLCNCSQNFTVDDQGEIGDFLGIQIQKLDDGSIMLTQLQLDDSIIHDLHLQSGSNPKTTPTVTTKLLHKDTDSPDMAPDFHYCSVIGKLNLLEKSTWPDISISMHQCA